VRKSLLFFLLIPVKLQAEEFSFDLSTYEKPAYELNGYLELLANHSRLNTDSAFYNTLFSSMPGESINNQHTASMQLDGLYRFDKARLHLSYYAETMDADISGNEHDSVVYELYYTDSRIEHITFDLGKRVQKWGKGYAWNPVGFIERKKDPNDPELSREGYIMLSGEYLRSFDGQLKTFAVMPVVLPVTDEINNDFSNIEDTNLAARAYLLYRDTDIDFVLLAKGSRAARIGIDFSRNISPNFEIHGEYAYIKDESITQLDTVNSFNTIEKDVKQALLGIRYLSSQEVTWIAEYYHNGAGYTTSQLEEFYTLASSNFVTDPALLNTLQQAIKNGYGNTNPGKDYLYFSANTKEPFDWLYYSIGLNSIFNMQDNSYSLTPELIYTGFNNTEFRLRITLLEGGNNSEFGEKINEEKLDLRLRLYF